MKVTRRKFLELGSVAAGVTCAPSVFGLSALEPSPSATEYRALVCIELGGGADSFNMLLPHSKATYRQFAERRGRLAPAYHELMPLAGRDASGRRYAIHPRMPEIQQLFDNRDLAIVNNVGWLDQPSRGNTAPERQDLSHISQIKRWHSATVDENPKSGWAGRIADLLSGTSPDASVPVNLSLSGRNLMQLGRNTLPANLQTSIYRAGNAGSPPGIDFTYINEQLAEGALAQGRGSVASGRMKRQCDLDSRSRSIIRDALKPTPESPVRATTGNFLADLAIAGDIIAARKKLGTNRQIIFIHFDGWDNHHGLEYSPNELFPLLSRGLSDFRNTLQKQGVFDQVTTFTVSEFGRTLECNGDGADHGWGGHHFVMGGSVAGGRFLGRYPDLAPNSMADIGGGCFIPSLSTSEYLADLALWFGVAPAELSYVFPALDRFGAGLKETSPTGLFAAQG